MTAARALLDTCALYPATLRDTLLSLAELQLYRPMWSAGILEELERNLAKAGVGDRAAARLTARMNTAFEDAEVDGHQPLTAAMTCAAKDRHVLAAAVHGRTDYLTLAPPPAGCRVDHGQEVVVGAPAVPHLSAGVAGVVQDCPYGGVGPVIAGAVRVALGIVGGRAGDTGVVQGAGDAGGAVPGEPLLEDPLDDGGGGGVDLRALGAGAAAGPGGVGVRAHPAVVSEATFVAARQIRPRNTYVRYIREERILPHLPALALRYDAHEQTLAAETPTGERDADSACP